MSFVANLLEKYNSKKNLKIGQHL